MNLRPLMLAALALAAILGSMDVFDGDGKRIGQIREGRDGSVSIYDAAGRREAWGRRDRDGSIELFDMKGNRIGTRSQDGKALLPLDRRGGQ